MKKIVYLFIIVLMTGCATRTQIEYRDREVIKYVNSIQRDTLINNVHDSIFMNTYTINDTVYQYKYKEKLVYKDRIVIKNDTIKDIQTEVREKLVTKYKVPKWCWWLLGINVLIVAFIIGKKYIKWQTRI